MKRACLVCVALLLSATQVIAGDIASDVRNGGSTQDSEGGYLELGVSLSYLKGPDVDDNDEGLVVDVAAGGSYRYRGFFIEAFQTTSDGVSIGYRLWDNERWSFDLLASSMFGLFTDDEDDNNLSRLSEARRNQKLVDQDTFYNGVGLRATGYFGDYVFQYRLVTDIHDGNGVISTARLGRSWQIKNWNLHSIISAQYTSAETNNYWYGISDDEATQRFPAYSLGSTISFSAEIGATYPLSEHWVYRSFIRYTDLTSEVSRSPLADSNNTTTVITSISYVF